MNSPILSIDPVSDGILVQFAGGLHCFYSADFLLANAKHPANCVFLDYDPTPTRAEPSAGLDFAIASLAAQIVPSLQE